jgi:hypothetical protein
VLGIVFATLLILAVFAVGSAGIYVLSRLVRRDNVAAQPESGQS